MRSVARALLVLDAFRHEGDLGIRQIARKIGISPAAAHRVAATLVSYGYLVQDAETKAYRLGPRIDELSGSVRRTPDVRRSALSYMRRLQELTQETVCLHAIRNGARACLLQLESPQELRMVIPLRPLPILYGASDLIFRAFASPEVRATFNRPFDLGEPLPPEPDEPPDLDEVRRVGWAVSIGSRIPGGTAVAAPVETTSELLALSVFGPQARMMEQGIERIAKHLTSLASELCAALDALGESLDGDMPASAS